MTLMAVNRLIIQRVTITALLGTLFALFPSTTQVEFWSIFFKRSNVESCHFRHSLFFLLLVLNSSVFECSQGLWSSASSGYVARLATPAADYLRLVATFSRVFGWRLG